MEGHTSDSVLLLFERSARRNRFLEELSNNVRGMGDGMALLSIFSI